MLTNCANNVSMATKTVLHLNFLSVAVVMKCLVTLLL